jgi:hypothetical protein
MRIPLEVWSALVQQGNYLRDNFGYSHKNVYVSGKYRYKDAIAQIEEVKAFLKEKNPNIEFPEKN